MMITHLQETFRAYAPQIMGREEVKLLLDKTNRSTRAWSTKLQNRS